MMGSYGKNATAKEMKNRRKQDKEDKRVQSGEFRQIGIELRNDRWTEESREEGRSGSRPYRRRYSKHLGNYVPNGYLCI